MRKRWVLLTSMLLLGSAGTAEAAPLDSPDIVYIDGLPCNRLCQSYMAWSRKASSISAQAAFAPRFPKPRGATGMRGEGSRSATRVRLAKPAAPNSNGMRQAPSADSQPARNAVAVSNSGTQERVTTAAPAPEQKAGHSDHAEVVLPGVAEKPASASSNNGDHLVAILVAPPEIKSVSDLTNKNIAIDDRQAASDAHLGTAIAAAGAGEVQLSEGQTKAINRLISGEVSAAVLTSIYPEAADWLPEIAGFTIFRIPLSPAAVKARLESAGDAAAGSNARTIQQQVAAAATLAEQVTAAPTPDQKESAASPDNTDHLVALLMARPDIKSVSDLANKNIAIDTRQSASNAIVRIAIAAAGATEVQLSEGHTAAIDRLINGEVPAAVLALVSPQAAEWFPEIAGYKILRIPLSPVALPARLEPAGQPAASAAADPEARKIRQQVTAATVIAEHVMTLRDAQNTTPASPNNDDRVVLLMARPEIRSISDLAGKDIAIDDRHSASNDKVRTAIAAAGAAEVQLSEGQTKAIDRLIAGEVPAAVLTLVYPETGFPQFAGFKIFRIPLSPRSVQARLETAGNAAAGSGSAPAKIPDSSPAGVAAANSNARTILEQVAAATALAEHVTAAAAVAAPEQKANTAEKTAAAPPNDTDLLVALLMARPEIKSVSDLASKNIAIDDRQSASSDSVRTAIAAAGAGEVQLSEGQTKAISRLISGEVPAAVLTLVSPEAAEWFPDIAGFKIFRVPLSPRSLKARL